MPNLEMQNAAAERQEQPASSQSVEKKQQAVDFKLLQEEMTNIGVDRGAFLDTMKRVKNMEGAAGDKAGVLLEGMLMGLGDKVFDSQAVTDAMRKMSIVVAESDFVGEDVSRAFVRQVGEAYGKEEDARENQFDAQLDAAQTELSEQGFQGEGLSQVVKKYHDGSDVQELAMELLNLLPEEVVDSGDTNRIGRSMYQLVNAVGATEMIDRQSLQQVLSEGMAALGVVESELGNTENLAEVDLENPGAYRVEIADAIENEIIPQKGVLAVRQGTDIINAMAKSVGYDGQRLVALFERTPNTGDEVANQLKDLYLNTNARDYLLAAQNEEQVSGFINSL